MPRVSTLFSAIAFAAIASLASAQTIAKNRAYTIVDLKAGVNGTSGEWLADLWKDTFKTTCQQAFPGTTCTLRTATATGAKTATLGFNIFQYTDALNLSLALTDQLNDVRALETFRLTLKSGTKGYTWSDEGAPKIVLVTERSKTGAIIFQGTITAGQIAGIVVAIVFGVALVVGGVVWAVRKARASAADAAAKPKTRV